MNHHANIKILMVVLAISTFWLPGQGMAQAADSNPAYLNIRLDNMQAPKDMSVVLQIFLLLTVLSLAPAILVMVTSFTRIAIVLSLLRQALGTNQMPPQPDYHRSFIVSDGFCHDAGLERHQRGSAETLYGGTDGSGNRFEAGDRALEKFMFKQTRKQDLALLMNISQSDRPRNSDDVSIAVLIPSFIISELKTAFQMGFLLYIPFLVIDMWWPACCFPWHDDVAAHHGFICLSN